MLNIHNNTIRTMDNKLIIIKSIRGPTHARTHMHALTHAHTQRQRQIDENGVISLRQSKYIKMSQNGGNEKRTHGRNRKETYFGHVERHDDLIKIIQERK